MTQQPGETQQLPGQAPRTGASGFRNNKMGPLLTPNHQRMISMNNSQAFSPMTATDVVSPNDILKEKQKIARFLNTKERSGQVFAEREKRIEERL